MQKCGKNNMGSQNFFFTDKNVLSTLVNLTQQGGYSAHAGWMPLFRLKNSLQYLSTRMIFSSLRRRRRIVCVPVTCKAACVGSIDHSGRCPARTTQLSLSSRSSIVINFNYTPGGDNLHFSMILWEPGRLDNSK